MEDEDADQDGHSHYVQLLVAGICKASHEPEDHFRKLVKRICGIGSRAIMAEKKAFTTTLPGPTSVWGSPSNSAQ